MNSLPKPKIEAIFYEDKYLYACLANFPITRGHVVIVWKEDITDLNLLPEKQYLHLMKKVDEVRNAMLKAFKIEKVYLLYMDEAKHVHWHLVPRYNEEGFNVFLHNPKVLDDFSPADDLKNHLKINQKI